jgi:hypothetical protein
MKMGMLFSVISEHVYVSYTVHINIYMMVDLYQMMFKIKYYLTLQCRKPYLTREAFKSHAAVLRI